MADLPNEMNGAETVSGRREPLHHSLAEELLERITDGRLPAGSKLPPLREIAAEFDVSTMTVRQAIRALEREGQVYRIPRVGAFVHAHRPHLRSGPPVLSLAGADLSNTFHVAIARGLQMACRRRGFSLRLLDASLESSDGASVPRLDRSTTGGIIVLTPLSGPRVTASLNRAQADGIPIVLIDQSVPGLPANLVASDHEAGGYEATNHLVKHGHQRVLMLTHPPNASSSVAARVRGYDQALRAGGIEPLPNWQVLIELSAHLAGHRIGDKWRGAYEAILPVLKRMTYPVGVVGIDAYAGWGIYEACRELGLRIPQDVSVVAFDDIDVTRALQPRMTIISQRTEEIGQKAVELLERELTRQAEDVSDSPPYMHLVVGIDLKEHKSVAPATPRRPAADGVAPIKGEERAHA